MSLYNTLLELLKSGEFFKKLSRLFFIFTSLFITVNMIGMYGLGAQPNISFTSFTFTLLSLTVTFYAVAIAIKSDEKMKSIATGDFYEITYRFWDRAPMLYDNQIKEIRDTQSWQLGNLFRHGEKLKKWADSDVQEKLIKEFKIFLERLRPLPCVKYYVEIKNYISICKLSLGFKTENNDMKNELIKEIELWVGKKTEKESNIEYLQRKSEELKEIDNYDVFTIN